MAISTIDVVIIVVYLIGILGVGLWSVRKVGKQTSDSYFLADRNLKWPVVGAALFASNIMDAYYGGHVSEAYKQFPYSRLDSSRSSMETFTSKI